MVFGKPISKQQQQQHLFSIKQYLTSLLAKNHVHIHEPKLIHKHLYTNTNSLGKRSSGDKESIFSKTQISYTNANFRLNH
jgi:hypothetical protein